MRKRLLLAAAVLVLFVWWGKQAPGGRDKIAETDPNTVWSPDRTEGRCEEIILILRGDGQFLLRRCVLEPEKARREAAWQGWYELEDARLTLHGSRGSCTLPYLDETLYWAALKKTPKRDPES